MATTASQLVDEPPQTSEVAQSGPTKGAQEHNLLNPGMPGENAHSFLFYSRGVGADTKGRGLQNLLHDVGEAAGDVLHGVDTFLKGKIANEMHGQVDKIQDATESRLMGGLPGQSNTPPPTELKQTLSGLGNLKTAATQGNIPHVYYEMQLNSVAKTMRSQYPGYRDYIDQEISHMTGGLPANKIIQDLFHAQAASTKEDHAEKFWWEMLGVGQKQVPGFNNDMRDYMSKNGGQKPPLDWMMDKVNGYLGYEQRQKEWERDYKLKEQAGNATTKDLSDLAVQTMSFNRNNLLKENGSVWKEKQKLDDIEKQFYAMGEGSRNMNPQQYQLAIESVNKIGSLLKAEEAKLITDPVFAKLDEKTKAQITKDNDELILLMTNSFAGKEFHPGLANIAAQALTYMEKADQVSILKGSEAIRGANAMTKLLGANAAQLLENFKIHLANGTLSGKMGEDLTLSITNHLSGMVQGKSTLSDAIHDTGHAAPGVTGAMVESITGALGSKEITEEGATNVIKSIYESGENFLTATVDDGEGGKRPVIASRADRNKVFDLLTSPKMIDRIKELHSEGKLNDTHWDAVKEWINKTSRPMLKQDAEGLSLINKPTSHFQVQFDPETNRFQSVPNPNRVPEQSVIGIGGMPAPASSSNLSPSMQEAHAKAVARNLNTHTSGVIRVMEATNMSPERLHQKLTNYFDTMGIHVPGLTDGGAEGDTLSPEDKAIRKPSRALGGMRIPNVSPNGKNDSGTLPPDLSK